MTEILEQNELKSEEVKIGSSSSSTKVKKLINNLKYFFDYS